MLLITYMITETHVIYQAITTKTSVNKIIHQTTHFYKGQVNLLQIHKTEQGHFGQL